jgi:hypothetical protein
MSEIDVLKELSGLFMPDDFKGFYMDMKKVGQIHAALDHAIECCEKVETVKGFCELQVEMCDRPGYDKAQHLCRLILKMINAKGGMNMINTQDSHSCLCSIIDQLQQIIKQNDKIISSLTENKTYEASSDNMVPCDACQGTGIILIDDKWSGSGKRNEFCWKCKGSGKV